MGGWPSSIWREMFSSTTMASSTTNPVARINAINDRLFKENPHRYMIAKVPTSETGTARLGINDARTLPGTDTPPDHQHHRDQQGVLGFLQGGLDHRRAVHGHVELDACRQQRLQGWQLCLDLVDGLDDVGAGLAVDHQQHRGLIIEKATVVAVLDAVGDARHIGQAQDCAVLLADHQRLVVLGCFQLVVGTHLPVALGIFDEAHGPALVGIGHRGAHFIEGQAVLVEQLGFHRDAHRRQRAAADLHFPTPLTWARLWARMVSAMS